ncbi:MAG: PT domain-containing protein [Hominenteromicrobium sp.]|uniref:PT domain-containing protein n=2 Tax=Hominenteromicrobium sp. TaxID=3073581 RepID=UPI0039917982
MKKRILGIALAICMMIFCVPMGVFAAEAPSFSGGTGTQGDPWLIASQADLTALAEFLNSGNAATFDTENAGVGNCHGYYFKQTADIDLTGVTWEPIGYSGSYYFAGNYDGGGHSITNAVSTGKVDPDGYATAGIFGWVAFGSVANLHVKNANFVATGQNNYSYVGGIAGVCYGSSIKNCSVENSSLESRRNNNNNCAGSIVGYSTGGTFEKCAAENNQIRTMAYGGGFVGEVDDDPNYGAGNSTFTNCYVANCTVISETDDSQGTSFSGGFAGEITDSTLTIQNCYVYQATLSTVGNAVPQGTGVFAGNLWGSSTIADTNCFFGACGTTENAGTASEKTEEEFRNGTVAGLLGEAFAQVGDYPKINGPADYSSVDAAIAKANALEKDNYKDFSAVEEAINAVVRDKNITEQGEVDAMAQAIENAITALQYKDADYTKVDEAIAKANALNKDAYTNFTAVEEAINAVVRDKNITEQDEVDAMAKAIEDAMAALEKKPAVTPTPTATPTAEPSASPTAAPTATPTATPTAAPSASPTAAPTATPTATPTAAPSASPTAVPTATPTVKPTATPSARPTAVPTATPTVKPTATPTPAPKADPNNPKTGSSNLPVVFGSAALVLSGGALAAVLIYKKKRHEK